MWSRKTAKYIVWSQKTAKYIVCARRVRIDAGITDDATRGDPAVLCVVKATMLARLDGGAIWRPSRPTLDLARLGAPEGGLRGEALDLALELRDLRRRGLGRGLRVPRRLRRGALELGLERRDPRREGLRGLGVAPR